MEDIAVLSAIEVYKETRFGIAKGYFHSKSLKQVGRINIDMIRCVSLPKCLLGRHLEFVLGIDNAFCSHYISIDYSTSAYWVSYT